MKWEYSAAVAVALVTSAVAFTALTNDGANPSTPGADSGAPDDGADPFLPDSAPRLFADSAGDATDTGAGDAGTMVGCVAGAILGECVDTPDSPAPLGTPGPHFDIVQFGFVGETVQHALFQLQIAKLSEDFAELQNTGEIDRMVWYKVCWGVDETHDGCIREVKIDVMKHDGKAHVNSVFEIRTSNCNEWAWCSWGVQVEIQFGAPATFMWRVPKAYLTADGLPATVHHLEAEVGWIGEPGFFPAWHPGVTVHSPLYHFHRHGGAIAGLNFADVTGAHMFEKTFQPWTALPVHPLDAPLLVGGLGANHGAGSQYDYPEMDVLWFDLYEDAGDLVGVFALQRFESVPNYDFDYSVGVGVGEYVWEIGYRQEGEGKKYGYAGRCIMEECQDGDIIVPEVELLHGSPGFILIRTPLEFLGNPAAGTATNLYWAMSMYSDVNYYWGDYEGDSFGDVHSVFEIDSLRGGGAPYVFGSGHRAKLDAAAHVH